MSYEDFNRRSFPASRRGLIAVLKLHLTKAMIDGKAVQAKTSFDIIDRLAKMAELEDLNPPERPAKAFADRSEATDAMNAYLGQWLADNPMDDAS